MIQDNLNEQIVMNRHRPLRQWILRLSPGQMIVVMSVMIFISELLVMLLLDRLPTFTPLVEAIVDSSFLILFLVPIYLALYRPFWKDRIRAEEEIRMLNHRLTDAVEDERRRLAYELHGHYGQTLTTLQVGVQALREKVQSVDTDCGRECQVIEELLTRLSDDLRSAATTIHPPQLDKLGLIPVLKQMVAQASTRNPAKTIELVIQGEEMQFDQQVSLALFRIAQEGLQNALLHSTGSLIRIYLAIENTSITLTIVDDGKGFSVERPPQRPDGRPGLGLVGMQQRARAVGGSLTVHSEKDRGTSIRARFPL